LTRPSAVIALVGMVLLRAGQFDAGARKYTGAR
jgi:hypothetical protein